MRNCPACLNATVTEYGYCLVCHKHTRAKIVLQGRDSPTWPYVIDFAQAMEGKLALNRHKGDRAGWLSLTTDKLWTLLQKELVELRAAIETGNAEDIKKEAADVANFAMMIADKASMPLGEAGSPNPR